MKNRVKHFKPYYELMRLNKPIGSILLLLPTLWAMWIAAKGKPPLWVVVIFISGVFVMRSAGCVINDIADRKFDGNVTRTRHRPLVVGTMSVRRAIMLFLALCLLAFVLVLQLNVFTIELSVVGLALAIIYPFTKRITYLPQLVLGAAFAWSVPMAFAAINNTVSSVGWFLYAIAVLWPFAYDTIYALMDKKDDLKVGVKSTAILFGDYDIAIIFILQSLVLIGMIVLGCLLHFNFFYFSCITIAFMMVCYQTYLIMQRNAKDYYRAFYNNQWLGGVILLGIIFNYFLQDIWH